MDGMGMCSIFFLPMDRCKHHQSSDLQSCQSQQQRRCKNSLQLFIQNGYTPEDFHGWVPCPKMEVCMVQIMFLSFQWVMAVGEPTVNLPECILNNKNNIQYIQGINLDSSGPHRKKVAW